MEGDGSLFYHTVVPLGLEKDWLPLPAILPCSWDWKKIGPINYHTVVSI